MRKLVQIAPISIGMLILLMALSPALASPSGPTVHILGGNSVRINMRVISTYHFGPRTLRVSPGAIVTFVGTGSDCTIDCDHTVSIVDKSQLPVNITQVFACLFDIPGTLCQQILSANYVNGRANVTGEPSGFQGANSIMIKQGQTLEVVIPASTGTGTTIRYMCAIHPWMQGSIVVGKGESDDSD